MAYRVVASTPDGEWVIAEDMSFEAAHNMATDLNGMNSSRNPDEPATITVTL